MFLSTFETSSLVAFVILVASLGVFCAIAALAKRRLFNFETVVTSTLISGILIAFGLEIFFGSMSQQTFRVIFFWLVAAFGLLLIRSVVEESKRRREAEEYQQKLDELQCRFVLLEKARTEFISIASHQLRTPLTIIRGYLSLALEDTYGNVSKELHEVLTNTFNQAEQMMHLVEQLLSVSRIESGTISYEMTPVHLDELVREIAAGFKDAAKKKKVMLRLRIPKTGVPAVMMDEKKIREVVRNILDNAVRYTSKGSVTVSMDVKGAMIVTTVKDTGLGMTAADIAQSFQRLSRGETVKTEYPVGTGLGLYISKKFIDAHKGLITAASAGPGKGSEFTFSLPVKKGKASSKSKA